MMIIKQYEAVVRKMKTETRRVSEKDTYKVGHTYAVVPKRAQPTVLYKWYEGELYFYHQDNGIPVASVGTQWQPTRVLILSKRWENLHDIDAAGAIAEGIYIDQYCGGFVCDLLDQSYVSAVGCYAALWDSINGKSKLYRWDANPRVCVHTFELVQA